MVDQVHAILVDRPYVKATVPSVSRVARFLTAFAVAAVVLVVPPLEAQAQGRTLYVAPWGNNYLENGYETAPNTFDTPWQTITFAIRNAKPGDTIAVRGGTYVEAAGWGAEPGTQSSPIVLTNYKNERVVIEGHLQLVGADYWTVDGIDVTYDPERGRTESLVKFDGGVGWKLINSEIWGTRGVSNLMITGQHSLPQNYRINGNCIHDNLASGDAFMNNHNIYLQPGYESGPGVIERNILFNAPNGANIKAAGGNPAVTGAANVSIRLNTMANAGAGVIVGYASHHVEMQRNLVGPQLGGGNLYTVAIIGNTVTGLSNTAMKSGISGYEKTVWSTDDSTRPIAGSATARVQPSFDSMDCSGFKPGNATASAYGRYATDTFRDDDTSAFENEIERIAQLGVTKGCNPPKNDLFCPEDSVTRGQMSAFIRRAIGVPDTSKDYFVDDQGSTFEDDINALAQAGIARGCNPPDNDAFCPNDYVTRGQMAAFLNRAFGYQATTVDHFADDDSNTFENDINTIAQNSITKGCNPPKNDRYCPDGLVLRGPMAAFLARAIAGG